jgi:hypothetical protein
MNGTAVIERSESNEAIQGQILQSSERLPLGLLRSPAMEPNRFFTAGRAGRIGMFRQRLPNSP